MTSETRSSISMDSRIQSTAHDAVRAKAAAVKAGYYKDPFVAAFAAASNRNNNHDAPPTVQPIIKRGSFARVACVERALVSFLNLFSKHETTKPPQVVVLGAGNDTTFFRLQAGLISGVLTQRDCHWFDVDYQAVISAKLETIKRSERLFRTLAAHTNNQGGVTMDFIDSEEGEEVPWKGRYHLVAHDLRGDIGTLIAGLTACSFDASAPTLVILECCLMYLPEVATRRLLEEIATVCTDACIFLYEPILGTDQFGQVMETNLTRAGVVSDASTLVQTRTLSQHIDNLVQSGISCAAGCDMWVAFETVLTPTQRQHANRCEFLDEVEEWMLIMRHYCIVVASLPTSTFGKNFCSVGDHSPMGLVAGRCDEALGRNSSTMAQRPNTTKPPSSNDNNEDSSSVDSKRFDTSGPQFRAPAKASSKVVLDERFASVLTDDRFQLQVQDKYGRKANKKNNSAKEELSAFYTVVDQDNLDNLRDRKTQTVKKYSRNQNEDDASTDDDDKPGSASRIAYLKALSRGQLDVSSSSSDDDSSGDSDSSSSDDDGSNGGSDQIEADAGGVFDRSNDDEQEIEITEESTRYLAVTNMDWTSVRALDIYALLSSFCPAGSVRQVSVFVSDFGQEKLADLERFGPSGVWKNSTSAASEENENEGAGYEIESAADDDDLSSDGYDDIRPTAAAKVESDFDREKLRNYEASKLRYYFAIAEFASVESAEKAYREVDGMEFEHSSAEIDLRAIPEVDLESIITDRLLRDEASSLPSNYSPPDFIVAALQQTNVTCTWDLPDPDRERTLTKYNSGEHWRAIAESEDLKAYLASDASSDEEEDGDKAMQLRKNLGLDSDSDDLEDPNDCSVRENYGLTKNDDGGFHESVQYEKEVKFIPGTTKGDLTEMIHEKLAASKVSGELTPWEKYKEKRKKKRQERRLTSRGKRTVVTSDGSASDDNGRESGAENNRAALELLVAGEENDDSQTDFSMRELQRLEKNAGKTLKGSRKRKEMERADAVVGTAFDVDVSDSRFQAVLDGADDKFGIDQTDSNFKKTAGMLKILKEQSRRRKKQRGRPSVSKSAAPDVACELVKHASGAKALSAIVQSLKAKHNK
ncbi:hypothetical protein MPSEU_000570900 [Mayamaea pseudoterrestris]|nr:hypothetical protein MPSEU_000570900 [Mayamaea pseudoterrestris]